MQTVAAFTQNQNPELKLARNCAEGCDSACTELYETYNRKIFATCLKILKNPDEAEDLTQDIFIQLFRKIGLFKGDSKLSTWIHRVTVNHALMQIRRRKQVDIQSLEPDEDGEAMQISDGENPLRMRVEDRLWLEQAVGQLAPGYKKVVVLHDIEGFEHEEIARLLNVSVGTSKSQLHKARLKLRGLLGKKANPRVYPGGNYA